MPLQYINEILGLPELQLQQMISIDAQEVHLEASPVAYKQPCPICHSEQDVKRDGKNNTRKIRHLRSSAERAICMFHPFAWLVPIAASGSFGRMTLSALNSGIAGLFVPKRSNKLSAPRQRIAQEYKKRLPVRCSGCIRKPSQQNATA